MLGAVCLERLVDPVGHPQQGELAQGGQVAGPEVVGEGRVDLLRNVDVPVRHAPAQPLRRHVDQLDLLGPPDDLVRDGLPLRHPGDLLHDVVERCQVLDVDSRDHIDPGGQQFFDVLPALGVAPVARNVAVRELVDDRDLRPTLKHRGEVHFLETAAPVDTGHAGNDLQVVEHRLGVRPAVALHEADHHIGAAGGPAPPLVQHAAGLADPWGGSQVDLQPPRPYLVLHRGRHAPLTGSQLLRRLPDFLHRRPPAGTLAPLLTDPSRPSRGP